MLLYLAALQGISADLYEAATVDGASRWQQFWHITMPSLRPAHYIVIALSLIDSFKVFDLIYAMTYGGPGTATQVMGTWMYFNVFQYYQAGYGTAIAVVITRGGRRGEHSVRPLPGQGARDHDGRRCPRRRSRPTGPAPNRAGSRRAASARPVLMTLVALLWISPLVLLVITAVRPLSDFIAQRPAVLAGHVHRARTSPTPGASATSRPPTATARSC